MKVYGNLDSINTQGRNLLINGDFQIDQRNAGASKTINTNATRLWCPDRWWGSAAPSNGVFTVQQVTSSIPASGAKYSTKFTVTTPDALGAVARAYCLAQWIEGLNVAKLMWGTANARSVTVSFYVRTSITGTFNGVLQNYAGTRSYPFTFAVSVADTWQYVSVTIPGETTGVWPSDNSASLLFAIVIGCGTTWQGTPNTWNNAAIYGATGATQLISTNGATLYLADVQLEEGKEATAFERLHTDDVLRKCQRYYEKSYAVGTVPGTSTAIGIAGSGMLTNTTGAYWTPAAVYFRQSKRATPVITFWDRLGVQGAFSQFYNGIWQADGISNGTYVSAGDNSFLFYGASGNVFMNIHWTAEAEL